MSHPNAWIYTRKSRALGDPDEPELLANHLSLLTRLAAQDNRAVPPEATHTEIGSGETIAGRPVFAALLSQWENLPRSHGGTVYVTEISRLTRNYTSDAVRVLEALQRACILIRTPSRLYDLNRADDLFLFRLEALFADRELSEAKRRLAAGQREARRMGKIPNGIAPFGYRYTREEKTLLPHPERFAILVECCTRALVTPVWRLAEEYGVPENCLLRALRNPTICGYPARRYGPRHPDRPDRKEYVPQPREQWLWPEEQNTEYPHACTREQWETLQTALDLRREKRARVHQGDGWCRDRVSFLCDPGPVRLGSYAVTRTRDGNVMCLTYERSRPVGAVHLFIPRQTVHNAVYPALMERLTDPSFAAFLASYEAPDAPDEASVDRSSLQRQIADTRRRYDEAVDAEMDTDDIEHRQSLSRRRLRLQTRLKELQKELQLLESKTDERQLVRMLVGLQPLLARGLPTVWEQMDGFERRSLVNACIERIEVVVEPTRPPRPHRREVTRIVWQPWLGS